MHNYVFSCNLPSAHLAKWPGFFTCYCGNTGVEHIPKGYWNKKILPSLLRGLEAGTFRSGIRRSNHWAITAPLFLFPVFWGSISYTFSRWRHSYRNGGFCCCFVSTTKQKLFAFPFRLPWKLPVFPSLIRLLLALTTSPFLILPGTLDSFLTKNCPWRSTS